LAGEGQPVPARVRIREGVTTHGDRRLLGICLANLLGNAVKFSSRTPQAEVEFGETVRDGRRCAFVRDNGAGFEMAHADKLFQAFVRLHRHEEFKGSGLGLNIARKIMEKHGGSLWGESAPGAGATFFFTLA
jgi:light-regulated signal transduction histidine kinase (bacteriophytochrome)